MTDAPPAAHQTVLVDDGRIESLGPVDEVVIPPGTRTIDAAGNYLIPGLIDMHVHIVPHIVMPREGGYNVETSLDMAGEYLALFPAFGVTTVRNMAGSSFLLQVRAAARGGRYPAPRIVTSGPILEEMFSWSAIATYAIKTETPEAARRAVLRQKALGYDCVKIYNNMSSAIFQAVIDESHALGMKVGGHVPIPVGLQGALAAGMDSIEHLRGFDVWLDRRPFHQRAPERAGDLYPGWRFANPSSIAELADIVAASDTWHVPTMRVEDPEAADTVYPAALLERLPWSVRQHLEGLQIELGLTDQQRSEVRAGQAARRAMLLELDRRNVNLLAGSDCPGAKARLIPGHSLLQEVESFVHAGIAPDRALKAATIRSATYLGLQDQVGTIEIGKRADLVLLDADPLLDIAALHRQVGTLLDGEWFETGERGAAALLSWSRNDSDRVAAAGPAAGVVRRGLRPVAL